MKNKGFFVCVEGLDGCGKTTQTKLLVKGLKRMGLSVAYTAEPSRGTIGRFIRKRYLHCAERGSAVVEALLFAADRLEHLRNEVFPVLAEGKLVVSDRYVYSSLAYQGAAGLSLEWIKKINEHAARPDLALFVDVEPETVIKRMKPKRSVMENLETQRKVRQVYLEFVQRGDLVKIDGNRSKAAVAREILETVKKHLKVSS